MHNRLQGLAHHHHRRRHHHVAGDHANPLISSAIAPANVLAPSKNAPGDRSWIRGHVSANALAFNSAKLLISSAPNCASVSVHWMTNHAKNRKFLIARIASADAPQYIDAHRIKNSTVTRANANVLIQ